MRTQRVSRLATPLAAAFALALAVPAAAQPGQGHGPGTAMPAAGLRAELIRDVESLERKYLGLAEAMTGKYGWRPAEGVRSVGEVFMHVAGANYMLPTMCGVEPPAAFGADDAQGAMARMQEMEKVTDEAQVHQALRDAFAHARHAIAAVPDDQLDAMTKLFGRDATKRAALSLLVTHMHEHLGQAIAYARTNGVIPPWSADGGD
jgi:uncharacterized damage-inducible protein DinB